jgi:transposase
LDDFFSSQLSNVQHSRIMVACLDMWEPFRQSLEESAKHCAIVYDRFHILHHANQAVDEVRRAEFFRKGGRMRAVVKGKRWLLLTRWVNLSSNKQQMLNELFGMYRKVMKALSIKGKSGSALAVHLPGSHAAVLASVD